MPEAFDIAPRDVGSPAPSHGGRLTVDLSALADNWRTLAGLAAPAECAAAVKGDGYGLGLEPVSRTLADAGCRTFFVAHLSEAERFRAALGPAPVLYVLNGLLPGQAPALAALDARPCLGSLEEAAEWRAFRVDHPGAPPVAIHIDTGFNRLGFGDGDLNRLVEDPGWLDGLGVGLLMSHLACADEPERDMNARQLARFEAARRAFPGVAAALGNSGSVFLGAGYHFDMVRAGIGLYGGRPFLAGENPMAPVARLEVPVIQTREVGAGESVGYGATYTFSRPALLALLSVGYADGFFRALSASDDRPGGAAFFGGHRAPIVGRVSMDVTAVDVTGVPAERVGRGEMAEILGPHQSAADLAAVAGTIDYEILTRLGSRYERIYSAPAESRPGRDPSEPTR